MAEDSNNKSSDEHATTTQKVAGQLAAWALPFAIDQFIDLKICHYDKSADPARPEYNEHCIFTVWHENIGLVLPRWGSTPLTALVSQHRDGEWVNQAAKALGIHIVRGSTSRGGSRAIRQLKRNGRFSSIAVTPDGPRGPRREMAAGPVYLASLLQMPIVPVGAGFKNPWRLKTWDRFALAKPFSRARMIFGPKIYLPKKMNRQSIETTRIKIQGLMNQLSELCDSWANSNDRYRDEQPFVRARRPNKLFFDKPRQNSLSPAA